MAGLSGETALLMTRSASAAGARRSSLCPMKESRQRRKNITMCCTCSPAA
ncbi:MAG: hypothetical protein ACLUI3_09655 [Christensenellales bacterium]